MYGIVVPAVRPMCQTHRQRLASCLSHNNIPDAEKALVRDTIIPACDAWIVSMEKKDVPLSSSVAALNEYKLLLDATVGGTHYISRNDGQLKLSGGLLEDFFVSILRRYIVSHDQGTVIARQLPCTSGISFTARGQPIVRTKVHDVVVARTATASFESSSSDASTTLDMILASVAIEVKTSLDKTMFQEACATATDLRRLVPDARYLLVCEWLDMAPIPTVSTAISQAYILRGRRKRGAGKDVSFFAKNPIREHVIRKIVEDAASAMAISPAADDAVRRGYF
jgi:hypothetical protein